MAGHARYTALLEACVLYPLATTDALMSLATAGRESAWTALVVGLELPDPNDRHVLAAAIAGHADCIVTSNLKDFPAAVLFEYGIEAVDPDTFIINQWDLDPVNAIAAFKRMRSRRLRPQSSPEDFAYALEVGGLPTTAQRLRLASELI